MPSINPTDSLGTGELHAPPGIELRTQDQKDLFRASQEFERFFLQHMMKQMQTATKSIGGEEDSDSSTSAYGDMANDQLVQSMLDGGGLGMASVLYQQMAEAAGIDTKPAKAGDTDTPEPTTDIGGGESA
jgi:flagellar protein FlgJ